MVLIKNVEIIMTQMKNTYLFGVRNISVAITIFRRSSWREAQLLCEAEGMTLLGNFDDATMKLVLDQYSEIASGDIVFIGLKRNDQVICTLSY